MPFPFSLLPVAFLLLTFYFRAAVLVVGLDPNPEMMPPGCDFQEDIERAHNIINKNYVKKS